MFVSKIMNNRKRIERTIAKYEQEQKDKLAASKAQSDKKADEGSE